MTRIEEEEEVVDGQVLFINENSWAVIIDEYCRTSGTGEPPKVGESCIIVDTRPAPHHAKNQKIIKRFVRPGHLGRLEIMANLLEKAGCKIEMPQ